MDIHVATDRIGSSSHDMNNLNQFCEKLRAAGHSATNAGRGDSAIQDHMLLAKNKCDIMIQIAGGLCPGTFGDFSWGTRGGKNCSPKGYYHADKYAILIETSTWTQYSKYDPKKYKLPASAHDDSFSQGKIDKSKIVGRTWQDICNDKETFPRSVGFVEGKSGTELAEGFIKLLNGGTSTTQAAQQAGGGGTIIDRIKEVCSDLDPYGVELELVGDTLKVHKSRMNQAKLLDESRVVHDSVTFTDYSSNTPNKNGSAKDQHLIDRFGEIPLETEAKGDEAQVLQVAQRDGGHSIDLKCILSQDYQAGKWVKLNLPSLDIKDRLYYVSKASYDEEMATTLTLERGPPSLHVDIIDIPEEVTEESTEEAEEGA